MRIFAADDNELAHEPRSGEIEVLQALRRRRDVGGESVHLLALHSAQVAVEVGAVVAEGAIDLKFPKRFLWFDFGNQS